MSAGCFNSERLNTLYRELDNECAALARQHGTVTAAQRNHIAARLMEAARDSPPEIKPPMTVAPARVYRFHMS